MVVFFPPLVRPNAPDLAGTHLGAGAYVMGQGRREEEIGGIGEGAGSCTTTILASSVYYYYYYYYYYLCFDGDDAHEDDSHPCQCA